MTRNKKTKHAQKALDDMYRNKGLDIFSWHRGVRQIFCNHSKISYPYNKASKNFRTPTVKWEKIPYPYSCNLHQVKLIFNVLMTRTFPSFMLCFDNIVA